MGRSDDGPVLTRRDWNEEWKRLQTLRRDPDGSEFWDKRARTFTTKDAPNRYVQRFLELAGVRPGESVFDMGCGTGALAVPLGEDGHEVLAADFSAGMLQVMVDRLREGGRAPVGEAVHDPGVTPLLLSWSDDWSAHGVAPRSFDVVLASRSLSTSDLRDSLLRLTEVARRRVCITLTTSCSPRVDPQVLQAAGVTQVLGNDYLYAFNILANEGLRPEVSYIESAHKNDFDSREQAYSRLVDMVESATCGRLSDEERADAARRLDAWLDDNLIENEDAGKPDRKGLPQGPVCLRRPRTIVWAFLAWDA